MLSYTYRTAEKQDKEKIVKFLLEHFIYEEPCIRAMNSNAAEWEPILREITENSLKTPFSTIVTTAGEVAAVLLNSIWRRDDSHEEDHDTEQFSEKVRKFIKVLQKCHEDFWSLAPEDVNVVIYREISSVGKQWQRQGIATKMVNAGLSKAREFGVGGVVSATSSFANQMLLAKRGFTCLKEYPYSGIVNEKGAKLLETDDGSKGMRMNFKRIEDFDIRQ